MAKKIKPILFYLAVTFVTLLYVANSPPVIGANQQVTAHISDVLEISVPSSASLDIVASSSGTFASKTINIAVGTNNSTGYVLSMVATSNNLNSTNSYAKIPSIDDATTFSAFPVNSWGISVDAGSTSDILYRPINVGTTKLIGTTTSGSDIIPFTVAAKVNLENPFGNYNGTVRIVAVANTAPLTLEQSYASAGKTKYNGYYKMQDMTSDICTTADFDEVGTRVIDARDDKVYWVAKLKDGNCWMTQNLDLDLSTSTILTDADTDLVTGTTYTPAVDTITGNVFNSSDKFGENSWDGGDYYWNGNWIGSNQNDPIGYGSSKFTSAFSANLAAAGDAGMHYHVGNLYQWSAATAKTGNNKTSGAEAASSICPKGWRLPYSGDNTTNKTFGYMLSRYGLTDTNTEHNINKAPLYFTPAGYVYSGKLYGAAYYGNYWSSRASSDSDDNAYYLYSNTSNIYPSFSSSRYGGSSVRCIAKTNG